MRPADTWKDYELLDAIHRCADRIVDKINKRILGQ